MRRIARMSIPLSLLFAALAIAGCNSNEPAAEPEPEAENVISGGTPKGFGIGPMVSAEAASAVEGNASILVVEISLSPPSRQLVHVDYITEDGTASAGADYQRAKGRLTFKPGETRNTINIQIVGDDLAEGDESFLLRLHVDGDVRLSTPEVSLTIVDDD